MSGLALIFHEQFLSFNGVVKESTLSSESMDAGEDPSDLDPTIDSDTTSEGLAAADRKVSASSNRSRKSTGGIRRQSAAVLMV